ncbi:GTP 3',8-cyclase MoaA [Cohnella pontilimi]|uniref:GTP 3',8-cyclase n=1 Tax=Cohnella pontilimi TaxID=2564100 RepID=A0A4U0FAE6_9BACL|nr:GTP 3',8-cyclase MoaA [Cohnella pontilimi]TJY41498.1 GTP 3',8-cyclase MoaA [Cohnella pontilimi]
MPALVDRFGRTHTYLRISVTDRCNFRCLYCMPEEGMQFMDQEKLLTYPQILEVAGAAARLGIRKFRITGGEPLVRPGLEQLIAGLAELPGVKDISLTTNGLLLAPQARKLKDTGLHRVNISLDTLDAARFRFIARRGDLTRVLEGVEAAAEAGLQPIKLNCVLLKGVNEDEIGRFLKLSVDQPLHIRFIEYMPIGHDDENWRSHYLPLSRVLEEAEKLGYAVEQAQAPTGSGPSEDYKIAGAAGTFGLIHPVSNHFCQNCNRLRLTADGNIKPCLYWVDELNVRPALGSQEALEALFRRAMDIKPENHEMAALLAGEAQSHVPTERRMSQIGG